MQRFRTPGVHIRETPKRQATIIPAPTAIPAFVGYTGWAQKDDEDLTGKAVRITSMQDFSEIFGDPFGEQYGLTLATENGEDRFEITGTESPYLLHYAMQLFYANGGESCYVVSAGLFDENPSETSIDPADLNKGLGVLALEDGPTLLVIPEAVHLSASARKTLHNNMLAQCADLKDRFAILDALAGSNEDPAEDAAAFRSQVGTGNLSYGAAYYPSLKTTINRFFREQDVVISDNRGGTGSGNYHNLTMPNLLTGIRHKRTAGARLTRDSNLSVIAPEKELYKQIKKAFGQKLVELYPSAALAGIYTQTDRDRGVWKAPANVSLAQVEEPSVLVTAENQQDLNVDSTTGKSVNAIRHFTDRGTLVWGARTLAGNDNEWRYVPVRRLFIFIEQSVKRSVEAMRFESNDANTWTKTRGMTESFLTNLWQDGAMTGTTQQDAFFVKVGQGETMGESDVIEGRLIIEVGVAAIRPAEFIILRIIHKIG